LLDGPHPALLVQGDDSSEPLAELHMEALEGQCQCVCRHRRSGRRGQLRICNLRAGRNSTFGSPPLLAYSPRSQSRLSPGRHDLETSFAAFQTPKTVRLRPTLSKIAIASATDPFAPVSIAVMRVPFPPKLLNLGIGTADPAGIPCRLLHVWTSWPLAGTVRTVAQKMVDVVPRGARRHGEMHPETFSPQPRH